MTVIEIDPHVEQRLQTERNIWLVTVRADGRPHLAPIWFVWHAHKVYICTAAQSVKARNISTNPNVTLSLEDGDKPIVIEGPAKAIEQAEPAVVAAFQSKYNWNITADREYDRVIEIEVERIRA
mgnify:CR=1 FL=1